MIGLVVYTRIYMNAVKIRCKEHSLMPQEKMVKVSRNPSDAVESINLLHYMIKINGFETNIHIFLDLWSHQQRPICGDIECCC